MRLAYGYPPTVFILEAPPAPWIFRIFVPSGSRKRPALWDWSYLPWRWFQQPGSPGRESTVGHFHGAMNAFLPGHGIGITLVVAMFATYMNQEHKTGIQCLSNGYSKPIWNLVTNRLTFWCCQVELGAVLVAQAFTASMWRWLTVSAAGSFYINGKWIIMDLLVEQGTLQSTNLSHLGKRKIIDSKVPAGKGHVISQECTSFCQTETTTSLVSWSPNSGPNLSRVFGGSHGVSASKPLFFKQMWYFWWLKSCELIVAYIYIFIIILMYLR